MQHPAFDHYTIRVKNLNGSAQFYRKVLRLNQITNRTKKAHIRWFSLGNGELHLVQGNINEIKTTIGVHLAFSVRDFEFFRSHLKRKGIPVHSSKRVPGEITMRADSIKQLYLQDTNGYWIEVNNSGT